MSKLSAALNIGSLAIPGVGEANMARLAIEGGGKLAGMVGKGLLQHGIGSALEHAFGHSSDQLSQSAEPAQPQPALGIAGMAQPLPIGVAG